MDKHSTVRTPVDDHYRLLTLWLFWSTNLRCCLRGVQYDPNLEPNPSKKNKYFLHQVARPMPAITLVAAIHWASIKSRVPDFGAQRPCPTCHENRCSTWFAWKTGCPPYGSILRAPNNPFQVRLYSNMTNESRSVPLVLWSNWSEYKHLKTLLVIAFLSLQETVIGS